jgi:hypothetical protein
MESMPGYLEGYGEGEERRGKIIRWTALGLLLAAVLAGVLYFILRDRTEKKQLEAFLADLKRKDYKSAYALWGCTDHTPCPQYAFNKFMEDWGPASPHANVESAKVTNTKSCSGGIIQFIQFPNDEVQLWVERRNKTIGFAPWPVCNPRMQVQ